MNGAVRADARKRLEAKAKTITFVTYSEPRLNEIWTPIWKTWRSHSVQNLMPTFFKES